MDFRRHSAAQLPIESGGRYALPSNSDPPPRFWNHAEATRVESGGRYALPSTPDPLPRFWNHAEATRTAVRIEPIVSRSSAALCHCLSVTIARQPIARRRSVIRFFVSQVPIYNSFFFLQLADLRRYTRVDSETCQISRSRESGKSKGICKYTTQLFIPQSPSHHHSALESFSDFEFLRQHTEQREYTLFIYLTSKHVDIQICIIN